MQTEHVNQHQPYGTNSAPDSRIRALIERYPLRIACVSGCVAWTASYALFGTRWLSLTGILVGGFYAWTARTEPGTPEPSPGPNPEQWFTALCLNARVEPPIVLRDWPTKDGHAFYCLVTHAHHPGDHLTTVAQFTSFAPLLRDVAGHGVRSVETVADVNHGGRATCYVNGLRLAPLPEPEDLGPLCGYRDCEFPAVHHVIRADLTNHLSCVLHLPAAAAGDALESHRIGDDCWAGECMDDDDGIDDQDETDRECFALPDPFLPLHLRHEAAREGSGVWAPPVSGTGLPAGAEPGTKGGILFDCLRAAPHPLSRSSLASKAGLAPNTASRYLADWLTAGAVVSLAGTWIASPHYRASANISCDGNEATAGA